MWTKWIHGAIRAADPTRPVIGIIRNEIRHPLSKMIIAGEAKAGDTIEVTLENGKPAFTVRHG